MWATVTGTPQCKQKCQLSLQKVTVCQASVTDVLDTNTRGKFIDAGSMVTVGAYVGIQACIRWPTKNTELTKPCFMYDTHKW
jgi:hypothetical protein